jgi:hypothetical protein
MKARQVIKGAAFGPETLRVLTHAFDAAWSAISDQYQDKPDAQVEPHEWNRLAWCSRSPMKVIVTSWG